VKNYEKSINKKKMKLKILQILNKSLIIAFIVAVISFLIPIVPCTKSPVIAEPIYKWSMCKLPNPFGEQIVGISKKFYGISTEPLTGLIIQFLIVFIIFTLIFMLSRRKAAKVLDLTRK